MVRHFSLLQIKPGIHLEIIIMIIFSPSWCHHKNRWQVISASYSESNRVKKKEPVALLLKLNLCAIVSLMAGNVFKGQELTGFLQMGFKTSCQSGSVCRKLSLGFPVICSLKYLNFHIEVTPNIYSCLLCCCSALAAVL